jgi:hypothetical protein
MKKVQQKPGTQSQKNNITTTAGKNVNQQKIKISISRAETPKVNNTTPNKKIKSNESTNVLSPSGKTQNNLQNKFVVSKSTQNLKLNNNLNANTSQPKLNVNISQVEFGLKTGKFSGSNFNKSLRVMPRVNSLKPFDKVDPEFYDDKSDLLWKKDLQRVKTEQNILSSSGSGKRFLNSHQSNFGGSDIFNSKSCKNFKTLPQEESKTIERSISLNKL